jgi:hypothetical protein
VATSCEFRCDACEQDCECGKCEARKGGSFEVVGSDGRNDGRPGRADHTTCWVRRRQSRPRPMGGRPSGPSLPKGQPNPASPPWRPSSPALLASLALPFARSPRWRPSPFPSPRRPRCACSRQLTVPIPADNGVRPQHAHPLGPGRFIQTAAMLVIGDEVLNGKTKDTNSNYFAKHCFELGIELKRIEVVPDEEADIVEAARRLTDRFDWVVSTGGIGPSSPSPLGERQQPFSS